MKIAKPILSLAFGVSVWLFWWLRYPYDLGFQEQNQLFLFTADYLGERLGVAGGLADWVAEFITQFNVIPCLGAALLAGVMVGLQVLVWRCGRTLSPNRVEDVFYPLSFVPSALLWVAMGDIYVMLSSAVALASVLALFLLCGRGRSWMAAVALAGGYWLLGPVVWVFALLRGTYEVRRWRRAGSLWRRAVRFLAWPASVVVLALVAHYTLLRQYPFDAALWGINYYRIPLTTPPLLTLTAVAAVVCPLLVGLLPAVRVRWSRMPLLVVLTAVVAAGTAWGLRVNFDRGAHELIAYDQLVRQENWKEILRRADTFQPRAEIGCVCINLALFMEGQMADGLDDYWQSGVQGLIVPRVRDFISNVASYEVFWRMGFVNSALRYAFDSQESIPGCRKSGRHMCRMAECNIVNGDYAVAEKYLDLLSHSLFYHRWAEEHRSFLYNDDRVRSDRIYGWLRAARFDEDFLYNYGEMDKMLAIIYRHNPHNVMAAQYFNAWKKLENEK